MNGEGTKSPWNMLASAEIPVLKWLGKKFLGEEQNILYFSN